MGGGVGKVQQVARAAAAGDISALQDAASDIRDPNNIYLYLDPLEPIGLPQADDLIESMMHPVPGIVEANNLLAEMYWEIQEAVCDALGFPTLNIEESDGLLTAVVKMRGEPVDQEEMDRLLDPEANDGDNPVKAFWEQFTEAAAALEESRQQVDGAEVKVDEHGHFVNVTADGKEVCIPELDKLNTISYVLSRKLIHTCVDESESSLGKLIEPLMGAIKTNLEGGEYESYVSYMAMNQSGGDFDACIIFRWTRAGGEDPKDLLDEEWQPVYEKIFGPTGLLKVMTASSEIIKAVKVEAMALHSKFQQAREINWAGVAMNAGKLGMEAMSLPGKIQAMMPKLRLLPLMLPSTIALFSTVFMDIQIAMSKAKLYPGSADDSLEEDARAAVESGDYSALREALRGSA